MGSGFFFAPEFPLPEIGSTIETMNGVKTGNAATDGKPRRGWYIGRFVDDDAYRQSHEVEVKWGIHPPGESRTVASAESVARTMSVLIRGRFRLTFHRDSETEEVLLTQEGDYALWLPGVAHTWIAEDPDETIMLTIRWPSLPP
jgi:hypothetical protein